jgi:hypothetical protein
LALSPLTITSGNKDKDPSFSAKQSRDEREIPLSAHGASRKCFPPHLTAACDSIAEIAR